MPHNWFFLLVAVFFVSAMNLHRSVFQLSFSTNIEKEGNGTLKVALEDPPLQFQETPRIPEIDPSSSKVIFYHIYLPLRPKDTENALRIVREQLSQMGGKDVTLLYNTIGTNSNALTYEVMQGWCQHYNLTACHHLHHYSSGMEEVTLQSVYNFCRAPNNDPRRVGYVHNKGSFHARAMNEAWRFLMTEALVRDECWNTATTNNQCNACGLFFTADWGLYFSGNVWTADCHYIQTLHSPEAFEAQSRATYGDALVREKLGQVQLSLYQVPTDLWAVGIGRFAAEWWIGSHPSLRPCDFAGSIGNTTQTPRFVDWIRSHKKDAHGQTMSNLLTQFTPQTPAGPYAKWKLGSLSEAELKMEYFLLPGRIHRWWKLYGQLPHQDSWVWQHYPQGEFWRQAVQEHGLKVLEKVLPLNAQGAAAKKQLEASKIASVLRHTSGD